MVAPGTRTYTCTYVGLGADSPVWVRVHETHVDSDRCRDGCRVFDTIGSCVHTRRNPDTRLLVSTRVHVCTHTDGRETSVGTRIQETRRRETQLDKHRDPPPTDKRQDTHRVTPTRNHSPHVRRHVHADTRTQTHVCTHPYVDGGVGQKK